MAGGFCWLRWTITETGCPAGWSRSMAALKAARPDRRGGGRRMYFSVAVGGNFHIWRQRWGSGEPEQITFGPTEEEGIAIAADGSSLITSIGMRQSAIWIHDASGDREIFLGRRGIVPSIFAGQHDALLAAAGIYQRRCRTVGREPRLREDRARAAGRCDGLLCC